MGTHSLVRSRWAAIGAAVAVSLGGGIGLVHATSPSTAATLVPITPCRVVDTRPDSTVGARNTPLAGGDTMTVAASGGDCSGQIPDDATGVTMNVTAIGATQPTFLTVWPAGAAQPNASSLNPVPGAPPTPNAVITGVSAIGEFQVFNLTGNVNVIIDINGYYTDHNHDDRYYTETEADSRFINHAVLKTRVMPRPFAYDPTFFGWDTVEEWPGRVEYRSNGTGNMFLWLDLGPNPAEIDGVRYGLTSVKYCAAFYNSYATQTNVSMQPIEGPGHDSYDTTDRLGEGCWTIEVNDTTGDVPKLSVLITPTQTGDVRVEFGEFELVWSPVLP